ncbi:hypothetical protein MSKU9_0834 [Komagataeibacter diospyri]|uniref:Bacterial mobilisation domain-containing protein n=2 Tax=Komagataeibacter diospyri TaxID=1932662 RepID=A0A4P5NMV2_9PROT|nr:hypothetical protein MSKU9_0834 [Komagataeibacter diospyri]
MATTYAQRFFIKSSPEEKETWKAHAKKLGLNGIAPLMRQLMRESVSTGKRGDEIREQLKNIRLELSQIGNNINQIAKRINQGNPEHITNIDNELNEITRTRKQLVKLIHGMRERL